MTIANILYAVRDHLHEDKDLGAWRSDYAKHGHWITEVLLDFPEEDSVGRPDVVDRICPYLAIVPIGIEAEQLWNPIPESRLILSILGVLESQSARFNSIDLQNYSGAMLKALTRPAASGIGWEIDSNLTDHGGALSSDTDIDLEPYEDQRSFLASFEIILSREIIFGRS